MGVFEPNHMDFLYQVLTSMTGWQIAIAVILSPALVVASILLWTLLFTRNADSAVLSLSVFGVQFNLNVASARRRRATDKFKKG